MVKQTASQVSTYAQQNKVATVVVIGLLVAIGGYFGYDWWRTQAQERAFSAFAESYATFSQAERMAGHEQGRQHAAEMWDESQNTFAAAYDQNSSTSYAPYLQMFEAQTLLAQGQADEALQLMGKAVGSFPTSSPFAYLYKVTESLVAIDHNQQESGLASLNTLADDTQNPLRDMAMYYLAQYQASQGNREQVDAIVTKMKELFGTQSSEVDGKSPFLAMAEQL